MIFEFMMAMVILRNKEELVFFFNELTGFTELIYTVTLHKPLVY